jgi:hypothetical protein
MALEGARQMLRAWACLYANQARWQIGNKVHHLIAIEFVVGNWLPCPVTANEVEPALADIESDRFDFHDQVLRKNGWRPIIAALKETGRVIP